MTRVNAREKLRRRPCARFDIFRTPLLRLSKLLLRSLITREVTVGLQKKKSENSPEPRGKRFNWASNSYVSIYSAVKRIQLDSGNGKKGKFQLRRNIFEISRYRFSKGISVKTW